MSDKKRSKQARPHRGAEKPTDCDTGRMPAATSRTDSNTSRLNDKRQEAERSKSGWAHQGENAGEGRMTSSDGHVTVGWKPNTAGDVELTWLLTSLGAGQSSDEITLL
jgi:hypothetical protein